MNVKKELEKKGIAVSADDKCEAFVRTYYEPGKTIGHSIWVYHGDGVEMERYEVLADLPFETRGGMVKKLRMLADALEEVKDGVIGEDLMRPINGEDYGLPPETSWNSP